jgi:hypothetical protein
MAFRTFLRRPDFQQLRAVLSSADALSSVVHVSVFCMYSNAALRSGFAPPSARCCLLVLTILILGTMLALLSLVAPGPDRSLVFFAMSTTSYHPFMKRL